MTTISEVDATLWDMKANPRAAALHFDLSVHNLGIQEYAPHRGDDRVFPHHYRFRDGATHPDGAPVRGVEIDESAAAEYPYERADLPVNRMLNGTLHS